MAGGVLEVFADVDALAAAAADLVVLAARTAIAERGLFHLALAGGTTPRLAYERLARRELPWSAIHIWYGDERCVPPDHPDSNHALAQQALLAKVALPAANVHRMEGEAADRDAAARRYAALLPERLDLLLLGIGPDGHTASLFPASPALAESVRRVVHVVGPKPPPHRLTLTPPALRAARSIVVLAAGAEKAAAIQRAWTDGDPAECPARLLRGATWLIDRAAAREVVQCEPAALRRGSSPA